MFNFFSLFHFILKMVLYETLVEHFGFTPISFVDDVINSVNDLVYQAIASVEEFVIKEIGPSEQTNQVILLITFGNSKV
jgi:hypothetical protein